MLITKFFDFMRFPSTFFFFYATVIVAHNPSLYGINPRLCAFDGDVTLSIDFNQLEENNAHVDYIRNVLSISNQDVNVLTKERYCSHISPFCIRQKEPFPVNPSCSLDALWSQLHNIRETASYHKNNPLLRADFCLTVSHYTSLPSITSEYLTHLTLKQSKSSDFIFPETPWLGNTPRLQKLVIKAPALLYMPFDVIGLQELYTPPPVLSYARPLGLGSIELRDDWNKNVFKESEAWFNEPDLEDEIEDAQASLSYDTLNISQNREYAIFEHRHNPWNLDSFEPYQFSLNLPDIAYQEPHIQARQVSCLTALPIELQEKILNYLGPKDLFSLRLTCKTFRHVGSRHMHPQGRIKLQKGSPPNCTILKGGSFSQDTTMTLIYTYPGGHEDRYALYETIHARPVRQQRAHALSLSWSLSSHDVPFLTVGPLWTRSIQKQKKFFAWRKDTFDPKDAFGVVRKIALTQLDQSIAGNLQAHQKLFSNIQKI
jgi:hypothetical protein